MNIGSLETPIGRLGLVEEDGVITQLLWHAQDEGERTALLDEGLKQLED
jgi:methylated-DNA-[protein]-cysteine S-methyltransferase